MNILLAPDSFKGSLSASEFCSIAAEAIRVVIPSARVIKMPLADGGEGTVEALVQNTAGEIHYVTVTGPTNRPVKAHYGILGDGKTAVIEMASASGLSLVPLSERNPMVTTTYGTGELVLAALDAGCTTIIMGIGGSATNDGGAGMLQALGFGLLDMNSQPICSGAEGLLKLKKIDLSSRDRRLDDVTFLVACDVNNPLYGPKGAAYVYGPQKGASKEIVPILDQSLQNFASVILENMNKELSRIQGVGAAGGLGAGLLAFLNAELRSGFEIIRDTLMLEKVFLTEAIDLVITGEGEINDQTVNGKLPIGVAQLAKRYQLPVVAIVGKIGHGAEKVYEAGIDSIFSIVNGPMSLDSAVKNADELLADCIKRVIRLWVNAKKRI